MTDPVDTPARLEEACQQLRDAAIRVASYSHMSVPPGYFQQIRASVDDGTASFSVQVELPIGAISVLVDGKDWASPQCLLRLEHKAAE